MPMAILILNWMRVWNLELRLDHKEQAEHLMLVDLARNDIARVCQSGTRKVQN